MPQWSGGEYVVEVRNEPPGLMNLVKDGARTGRCDRFVETCETVDHRKNPFVCDGARVGLFAQPAAPSWAWRLFGPAWLVGKGRQ